MPDIIGKAKEKYREIMESEKMEKIKKVGKALIPGGMIGGILKIGKMRGKIPLQREIKKRMIPIPKEPKKKYPTQIA